jgi:hypothetical protein
MYINVISATFAIRSLIFFQSASKKLIYEVNTHAVRFKYAALQSSLICQCSQTLTKTLAESNPANLPPSLKDSGSNLKNGEQDKDLDSDAPHFQSCVRNFREYRRSPLQVNTVDHGQFWGAVLNDNE